jgi:hypothetical protein
MILCMLHSLMILLRQPGLRLADKSGCSRGYYWTKLVLHAPPNQGFTKLWLDRELGNDFRALRTTRDPGALESGGRNAKFRARGLTRGLH